jgi:hypothetical protein
MARSNRATHIHSTVGVRVLQQRIFGLALNLCAAAIGLNQHIVLEHLDDLALNPRLFVISDPDFGAHGVALSGHCPRALSPHSA